MAHSKALQLASHLAVIAAASAAAGKLITSGLKPESQLYGRTLISGNDPDEWALTYDDGPNPRSTPALLDVLDRFGAKATFFAIGKFAREDRALLRRVHEAGHIVGNHTMSHPFLATRPMHFVQEEVMRCSALLADILGAPVRYFRAPYGARRPGVLRFVREQGMVPVQWNVQGNDWEPIGVEGILAHLSPGLARARRRGRGANILLHDGFDEQQGYDRTHTVQATEALLQMARRDHIRIVTVDRWDRG